MGKKPDRKRIAVAAVMILAYAVYAAAVISILRIASAQSADVLAERMEEPIQMRIYVQFGAESILCLAFLMESWYVWFQTRQIKQFALEMGCGILLTALLGVAGYLTGRICTGMMAMDFFDPLFMTVEIAALDLILAATILRDRKKKR